MEFLCKNADVSIDEYSRIALSAQSFLCFNGTSEAAVTVTRYHSFGTGYRISHSMAVGCSGQASSDRNLCGELTSR